MKNKRKRTGWIIALAGILILAFTSPKTIQDYGKTNPEHWRVSNYVVFTTLSASYKFGSEWRVHQVGVLGFRIKIRE